MDEDVVVETAKLMRPGEAARVLSCSTFALADWAERGLIRVTRLPSGHRRYYWEDIRALLTGRVKGGR